MILVLLRDIMYLSNFLIFHFNLFVLPIIFGSCVFMNWSLFWNMRSDFIRFKGSHDFRNLPLRLCLHSFEMPQFFADLLGLDILLHLLLFKIKLILPFIYVLNDHLIEFVTLFVLLGAWLLCLFRYLNQLMLLGGVTFSLLFMLSGFVLCCVGTIFGWVFAW